LNRRWSTPRWRNAAVTSWCIWNAVGTRAYVRRVLSSGENPVAIATTRRATPIAIVANGVRP
jgi:hypothetical protein